MEQRLSLVTLAVADVGAARGFYERLGWRAAALGDGEVAFFQCGGMIVSLFDRAAQLADAGLPPEQPPAGGPRRFGGVVLAYNTRDREEVDTVLAAAAAAGGRLLRPAATAFWGGYTGYFADPDGHVWEVAWNPDFPIAEDGSVRLPG